MSRKDTLRRGDVGLGDTPAGGNAGSFASQTRPTASLALPSALSDADRETLLHQVRKAALNLAEVRRSMFQAEMELRKTEFALLLAEYAPEAKYVALGAVGTEDIVLLDDTEGIVQLDTDQANDVYGAILATDPFTDDDAGLVMSLHDYRGRACRTAQASEFGRLDTLSARQVWTVCDDASVRGVAASAVYTLEDAEEYLDREYPNLASWDRDQVAKEAIHRFHRALSDDHDLHEAFTDMVEDVLRERQ